MEFFSFWFMFSDRSSPKLGFSLYSVSVQLLSLIDRLFFMDRDAFPVPAESQKNFAGPSSALAYLDPLYWDERFRSEEHYEWFKDYSHFQHLIQRYIKPASSVLELGCGNSQLCEELHNDGITNITCIDLSAVAVENMMNRLATKGFKDSGDPWNPRRETVEKVKMMLQEVHRVLKAGGVFISISFGQPHFRRPLFEDPEFTWSFEWSTFGDGFHYFFYVLQKGERSKETCKSSSDRLALPSFSLLHEELENEDYIFRTNVEELGS